MAPDRRTIEGPEQAECAVRELLVEITRNEAGLHHPSHAPLEAVGVDSVAMIELIYALENRFAIRIGDHEVSPETFASIAAVAALVARKCHS